MKMRKWLGIVLCGLLLMVWTGAIANEQQPYFGDADQVTVYDNDTVTLTVVYTGNCEKLRITYSFHNNIIIRKTSGWMYRLVQTPCLSLSVCIR